MTGGSLSGLLRLKGENTTISETDGQASMRSSELKSNVRMDRAGPQPNRWLRRFSQFICLATLFLIFAGAMVKSTDSGLAVPDWPLSYGMLFPPMVGGVFYEHGHRMVAAAVGMCTLCLAVWLGSKEPRRWVRYLGFFALGAVVVQGLLGGITVLYFLPTGVSVVHGILAQTFFVLTIVIAYSQSVERRRRECTRDDTKGRFLRLTLAWTVLIFIQLVLGAVMRHTESGLAIPDFPRMSGQWVPAFNSTTLKNINDWRFEHDLAAVTQTQVFYHFLHRVGALVIVLALCFLNIIGWRQYRGNKTVGTTLMWLDALVVLQLFLGSLTVLMLKAPRVTSMHVVTGAAILGVSVLLCLRLAPVSFMDLRRQIWS